MISKQAFLKQEARERHGEDRGFQVVSKYRGQHLSAPYRSTKASAGYDIKAAKTMTVYSIPRTITKITRLEIAAAAYQHAGPNSLSGLDSAKNMTFSQQIQKLAKRLKPVLVPTGIKVFMKSNEYLAVYNRSSNPLKRGLHLANNVGIIDADYYNNPSNEGELFGQFTETGWHDYTIHKGDRIMQGIFHTAHYTFDDAHKDVARKGGLGSTKK